MHKVELLRTFKHELLVGSHSYISPPSLMFVSAAVSEIHEFNQKKKKKKKKKKKQQQKKKKKKEREKNSEIGYFQFNTFPRHIILTRGTF